MKFVDGSIRSFAIAPNATVEELLRTVVEKLEIRESGNFAIFELKDELGMLSSAALVPILCGFIFVSFLIHIFNSHFYILYCIYAYYVLFCILYFFN